MMLWQIAKNLEVDLQSHEEDKRSMIEELDCLKQTVAINIGINDSISKDLEVRSVEEKMNIP